jgi:large subunit ribosomal protein L9
MRVILLRDVAKIGRRMDIVTVPDGYAMNKLVPQGMALPATPENLKRVRADKAKVEIKHAHAVSHYQSVIDALKDKVVTVTAPANADGGLFKSVKADAIASAAAKTAGLEVPTHMVLVPEPIKHTGEYDISFTQDTHQAIIKVAVVAA